MSYDKLLLITFDYELFLGGQSGTVEHCLINPTDKLLAKLEQYSFKAFFFIDTVYLLRLKEVAGESKIASADLHAITNQLIRIVKSGHEIHPHFHPHWIDAVYYPQSNEWSLNEKRYYSWSSLSEERRKDLFEHGHSYIRSILDAADSGQTIDSYRAGGWSIQPFESFRPWFIQFGIRNEWSVIPGKYQFSDAHYFDFRNAPIREPVYCFDRDPCHEESSGPFMEWTISCLTLNRCEKWIDFKVSGVLRRIGKRPNLKGIAVSSHIKEEGDIYRKERDRRVVASFEGLNPFRIGRYLSSIRKTDYFQFISHPKLITPYEFTMIDKLFKKLKKKYILETDFRKALQK